MICILWIVYWHQLCNSLKHIKVKVHSLEIVVGHISELLYFIYLSLSLSVVFYLTVYLFSSKLIIMCAYIRKQVIVCQIGYYFLRIIQIKASFSKVQQELIDTLQMCFTLMVGGWKSARHVTVIKGMLVCEVMPTATLDQPCNVVNNYWDRQTVYLNTCAIVKKLMSV